MAKFNLLRDYLHENGKTGFYEADDNFGKIYIDGKGYKIFLTLSPSVPDSLCYSIVINRRRYRFGDGEF